MRSITIRERHILSALQAIQDIYIYGLQRMSRVILQAHSPDYSKDTFIWTAPAEPQKVIISVIVTSNWLDACKDYAAMPINISPLSSITVVKNAIPKDPQAFQFTGSPDIGPFTLYDDGISNPDSTSNSQTFDKLLPGTYSIEETVPAGWMLTRAVCSDGSPVDKIDLAPGETVTATFTDTELGRIEITKVVNWNGVTSDPSQTFEICLRGPSYPLGTEEWSLARPQALRAES